MGVALISAGGRWKGGLRASVESAAAAALAWSIAQELLGHRQPVFAAVAAVVCLAPGLPNRAGQAVNMLLGLVTGIAAGEAVLLLVPADWSVPVEICAGSLVAMLAALSFGALPVIPIQGAVSAILVLTMGPATAGSVRLTDALVGTCVALLFSQALFTPDPVRLVERVTRSMLGKLAPAFRQQAMTAVSGDRDEAAAASETFFSTRNALNELIVALDTAAAISRWSIRGRGRMDEVQRIAQTLKPLAIRLFAFALILTEIEQNRIRCGQRARLGTLRDAEEIADRLDAIATRCSALAMPPVTTRAHPFVRPESDDIDTLSIGSIDELLTGIEALLLDFEHMLAAGLRASRAAPRGIG